MDRKASDADPLPADGLKIDVSDIQPYSLLLGKSLNITEG